MKLTATQLRRIIAEEAQRLLSETPESEAASRWAILKSLLADSAPKLAALPGLQEEFIAAYAAREADTGNAVSNEMWILLEAIDKVI